MAALPAKTAKTEERCSVMVAMGLTESLPAKLGVTEATQELSGMAVTAVTAVLVSMLWEAKGGLVGTPFSTVTAVLVVPAARGELVHLA